MRVEFHPDALREVEDAQASYEARSVIAASAFLRKLSLAIQRVREALDSHAVAEAGTRRLLLDRFPFTIYYRLVKEAVIVAAVAHQTRRPGYWSTR